MRSVDAYHTVVQGEYERLQPRVHLQLGEDTRHVVALRHHADPKLVLDLWYEAQDCVRREGGDTFAVDPGGTASVPGAIAGDGPWNPKGAADGRSYLDVEWVLLDPPPAYLAT